MRPFLFCMVNYYSTPSRFFSLDEAINILYFFIAVLFLLSRFHQCVVRQSPRETMVTRISIGESDCKKLVSESFTYRSIMADRFIASSARRTANRIVDERAVRRE